VEAVLKFWPIVASILASGAVAVGYIIKASRILERIEQVIGLHSKTIDELKSEVKTLDSASRAHSSAIAVLQATR